MGETEERWFGASVEALGRLVNRNFASQAHLSREHPRGGLLCFVRGRRWYIPRGDCGQSGKVDGDDAREIVFV
jgi:hypothetical protein